jgi:hypothetical protein
VPKKNGIATERAAGLSDRCGKKETAVAGQHPDFFPAG